MTDAYLLAGDDMGRLGTPAPASDTGSHAGSGVTVVGLTVRVGVHWHVVVRMNLVHADACFFPALGVVPRTLVGWPVTKAEELLLVEVI